MVLAWCHALFNPKLSLRMSSKYTVALRETREENTRSMRTRGPEGGSRPRAATAVRSGHNGEPGGVCNLNIKLRPPSKIIHKNGDSRHLKNHPKSLEDLNTSWFYYEAQALTLFCRLWA